MQAGVTRVRACGSLLPQDSHVGPEAHEARLSVRAAAAAAAVGLEERERARTPPAVRPSHTGATRLCAATATSNLTFAKVEKMIDETLDVLLTNSVQ